MSPISCAAIALYGLALALLVVSPVKRRLSAKAKELLLGAGLGLALVGIALSLAMIPFGGWWSLTPLHEGPITATRSLMRSPLAETPDETPGVVNVLYRFGCKDCEDVYPALKARLEAMDAIVRWVPSRSPEGHALVEAWNVQTVPSAIVFAKDPSGNEPEATTLILFDAPENEYEGQATLDENAMARLEELIESAKETP